MEGPTPGVLGHAAIMLPPTLLPTDILSHMFSPISNHVVYFESLLPSLTGRKFPQITSRQRQEATPGINGLSQD